MAGVRVGNGKAYEIELSSPDPLSGILEPVLSADHVLKEEVAWSTAEESNSRSACHDHRVSGMVLAKRCSRTKLRLNGQIMQDSNTKQKIFPILEVLVYLAKVFTLEPGDLIFIGTPPGVGFAKKPPLCLKAGDVCEVEIEGLGVLRNPVVQGQLMRSECPLRLELSSLPMVVGAGL